MAAVRQKKGARAVGTARRARGGTSILALHGPDFNLPGTSEPAIYGRDKLAGIDARLVVQARAAGLGLASFQGNFEGELRLLGESR